MRLSGFFANMRAEQNVMTANAACDTRLDELKKGMSELMEEIVSYKNMYNRTNDMRSLYHSEMLLEISAVAYQLIERCGDMLATMAAVEAPTELRTFFVNRITEFKEYIFVFRNKVTKNRTTLQEMGNVRLVECCEQVAVRLKEIDSQFEPLLEAVERTP